MFRLLMVAVGVAVLLTSRVPAGDDPADDPKPKKQAAQKPSLKVEGKLTEDDPKDKFLKKSPHKVHQYKMKAKSVYVIDLSSKDFDSVLRIEDSKEKHLAANDDFNPPNLDSRLIFKAPKDDTYRIIATNLDGKEGSYLLTVRAGTEEDIRKADPFHAMIGKPAPEIVGEFSINGEARKLSELKGKVVLLDFWAVWCGPCIRTFPHLRDWDKKFKKDGLEILGVTTYFQRFGFDKEKGQLKQVAKQTKDEDTGKVKIEGLLKPAQEHEVIKDFAAHHKLTYELMTMTQANWAKASKDYRITGIPHVVLVDRAGNIRMVRVGSSEENAEALREEIQKLLAQK
ncbi:MAG: redoxin domain-containing protein [Planctomycetes bacterium]|nr:redoxin domain-containing protein [Planctomycetota bacterium]